MLAAPLSPGFGGLQVHSQPGPRTAGPRVAAAPGGGRHCWRLWRAAVRCPEQALAGSYGRSPEPHCWVSPGRAPARVWLWMALGLPCLWFLPGPGTTACGAGAGPPGPERPGSREQGGPRWSRWPRAGLRVSETHSTSARRVFPAWALGRCVRRMLQAGWGAWAGWPLCPLPEGPPGRADPLSVGRAPAAHSLGSKGWERRGNRISPFPGLEKTYCPSLLTRREKLAGGEEELLGGFWLLPAGSGALLLTHHQPLRGGGEIRAFPISPSSGTPDLTPLRRICFPGWGVSAQWHPLTGLVGVKVSLGQSSQCSEGVGCPSGPWPAGLNVPSG